MGDNTQKLSVKVTPDKDYTYDYINWAGYESRMCATFNAEVSPADCDEPIAWRVIDRDATFFNKIDDEYRWRIPDRLDGSKSYLIYLTISSDGRRCEVDVSSDNVQSVSLEAYFVNYPNIKSNGVVALIRNPQ